MDIKVCVFCSKGSICKRNKISRNNLSSLVNKLVEGMLAVGTSFSPENLTCVRGNRSAIPACRFAVGLHGELLEICRESMQVLAVWKYRMRCRAKEIDVPNV